MVVLCGNCEEREAVEICEQCEGEDSMFCKQCWDIHVQVKAFRKHKSHSATTTDSRMSDGEEISSRESESESSAHLNLQKLKLEKGKTKIEERSEQKLNEDLLSIKKQNTIDSVPNLKLKKSYMEGVQDAFLNISSKRPNYEEDFKALFSSPENKHVISEGGNGDTDADGLTTYEEQEEQQEPTSFFEYCDNLIEACSNISDGGEMTTNTMLYGFIAALLVHIVTKIIFGRMSIFVVVCLGMSFVAIVKKKQNILSLEISKLQNANAESRADMKSVSIGDPALCMNNVGAQNDFWHADRGNGINNKGPRIRPRTRPFSSNYRGGRGGDVPKRNTTGINSNSYSNSNISNKKMN